MEPMFLQDVEASGTQSPFNDLVRLARTQGAEYFRIWHMFAFKPHATKHVERSTSGHHGEPAPISPGLRELIAAFTSARNACPF